LIEYISILGSTGSIGTQTLEVAESLGIKIVGLAALKNVSLMEEQARRFKPEYVALHDEEKAKELKLRLADTSVKVDGGLEGVCRVAALEKSHRVVAGIVGIDGLLPTVSAIEAGKDICLANKETLVTAGDMIIPWAKQRNISILPVDSEHSAIFQSMESGKPKEVKRIILTASGGAFLGKKKSELENVTVSQALAHPNWDMGSKITVDSATLMNKGFEVIEAMFLFGTNPENIQTVIHPQSIIHSAVEFTDGSVIAQMGLPDMRLPIQYALTWPDRLVGPYRGMNFFDLPPLTFQKPDYETFGCLKLAYQACTDQKNMRIVLNSANDMAVEAFIKGRIGFLDIYRVIRTVIDGFPKYKPKSIEEIVETVRHCREYTEECIREGIYRNIM
jgi:1-deoxy-D-xylulose-5-phosphate reductoisomerase